MLQKLIESLADSETPLEAGLRHLLVIAYRANSKPLKEWVERELNGYDNNNDLPNYRRNLPVSLRLQFTGYGGSSVTTRFIGLDIPEELRWWSDDGQMLRQSVTELTALAEGDQDPGTQLPTHWVGRYQAFVEEGRATGYELMFLNNAHIMIPRTMVISVLGNIRNSSLKMALELESVSPDLGRAGGAPSEQVDAAQPVINLFIGQMTGDLHAGNESLVVGDNPNINIDSETSYQHNENAGESLNYQGSYGVVTQRRASSEGPNVPHQ